MFGGSKSSDIELYDLLNVRKDSSPAEIKKSYRKLAMKYHPDRNPDNKKECGDKFKEISEAHNVLSDSSKRKMMKSITKIHK